MKLKSCCFETFSPPLFFPAASRVEIRHFVASEDGLKNGFSTRSMESNFCVALFVFELRRDSHFSLLAPSRGGIEHFATSEADIKIGFSTCLVLCTHALSRFVYEQTCLFGPPIWPKKQENEMAEALPGRDVFTIFHKNFPALFSNFYGRPAADFSLAAPSRVEIRHFDTSEGGIKISFSTPALQSNFRLALLSFELRADSHFEKCIFA